MLNLELKTDGIADDDVALLIEDGSRFKTYQAASEMVRVSCDDACDDGGCDDSGSCDDACDDGGCDDGGIAIALQQENTELLFL